MVRATNVITPFRILFLRLIGWSSPVSITINHVNISLRLDSPDLSVALESLGKEFEPLRFLLEKSFDGLIVDAGGYIGTAAIKFAQMYSKAIIVTVEPSKDNYDLLVKNTKMFQNIIPINAALVASDRKSVNLFNRGTGHWGYTLIEDPLDCSEPESLGSVDAITIRTIKRQNGGKEIGILKLDIEGGEKDLFDSKDAVLDDIFAIFVELHDRILQGCSS